MNIGWIFWGMSEIIREMNMKNLNISNVAISSLVLFLSALGVGCGGSAPIQPSPASSSAPAAGPLSVSVIVTPQSVGVQRGGTWSFSALIVGSTNTAVTWGVQENSAGGTISGTGVYTAPAVDGVYHVVATAQADPNKSAMATVHVVQSGFTPTGNLSVARLAHTATLLQSGKVLVAGGGYGPDLIDGFWVVDQAELFDPATGSFSSAGVAAHNFHTSTLLLNGDVLLVGGETGWSGQSPILGATADLRRIGSGLFEPTGSLATGRESHAATLLDDGRVLVTGGVIPLGMSWQALQEAELYDPGSGTFATAANMNVARAFHTATLLANGKVLVTGGGYQGGGDTAELFDPATGCFTLTGHMTVARSTHTSTLLPNGKVLIAGSGQTAELYDPVTGLFTPTGSMAIPRFWHTATMLPDGTVLIAGGSTQYWGSETATTEIYDPGTGSFSPGASMRQGRFSHTATSLPGGKILFVGGASSSDGIHITALASAEIYN